MWKDASITIGIYDAERSEVIVTITTPAGDLAILGTVTFENGVLTMDRVHIQGPGPGALGRAGLNAIGRQILEDTGATALVVQGSPRTTGRNPDRAPLAIRFPRQADPVGGRDA